MKSKKLYALMLVVVLALFACSNDKDNSAFAGSTFALEGDASVTLIFSSDSVVLNIGGNTSYSYSVSGDTLRLTIMGVEAFRFTISNNNNTLTGTGAAAGMTFTRQ